MGREKGEKMQDRKSRMMQAAIKLFSKKGYHASSMQEIADVAGFSKGLLYKYFESKEALLIEVFKWNHDNMVERARYINVDASLTPKEKLRQMLTVEFEGVLGNKDYFNLLTKSLLIERNKQVQPFLKQVRAEMLDWHREMLLQVYGQTIQPIIWDMVLILQGILKEYVAFIIQDKEKLASSEVAALIVNSIDAIIVERKNKVPVITENHMKKYDLLSQKEQLPIEDQMKQMLDRIKIRARNQIMDGDIYHKLLEGIKLFEQEIESEKPRPFLLESLYLFLRKMLENDNDVFILGELIKKIEE